MCEKKRILIADDEPGIIRLLRDYFEMQDYQVKEAENGLEVLENLDPEPDLILLDVSMPMLDGFTVCERIRMHVSCPIVFLSAKVEEADRIRGLMLGGDDYILKPFGIGELRARVAAHLRRESREKKYAVSVGGVSFKLKAKQAFYEGKELEFTKSEYAICEYLAMNRGQVFSKERIYEAVFGYDGESDNSVITEHVKNIRAKLKKVHLEPIETVWGIGYRWKQENVGH